MNEYPLQDMQEIDQLEHLLLTQPNSQNLSKCLAYYEALEDWSEIVQTVEDWQELFVRDLSECFGLYQKSLALTGKWNLLEAWIKGRRDLSQEDQEALLASYRGDYLRYKALAGEKQQEDLNKASRLLLRQESLKSDQASWVGSVLRKLPFHLSQAHIEYFLQHPGIPLFERGVMLSYWQEVTKTPCLYRDWQGRDAWFYPELGIGLESLAWFRQAQSQADQDLLWAKLVQDAIKLYPQTSQVIPDLEKWMSYYSQWTPQQVLESLMEDDHSFVLEYRAFLGVN